MKYGWLASVIVLISVFIYAYLKSNLIGALLVIFVIAIISTLTTIFEIKVWKRANHELQKNIIVVMYVLGFGTLTTVLLFFDKLGESISTPLFYVSIFLIVHAILFKRTMSSSGKADSLEEKVKNDLKIVSKTYNKSFPGMFRWVGGFVTPSLPFFSFVNKDWLKGLDAEAVIHENVHIYYLQNGAIFLFIFGAPLYLYLFKNLVSMSDYGSSWLILPYVVFMLVLFEYVTFKKTKSYAKTLGIETRSWSAKICLRYIGVYVLQIGIVLGIIELIRFILKMVF
jgi:hypothetical protein